MRAGMSRVQLGGHVPQPICGARVPVALRWRGWVRWLICCQRGPRRPLGLLLCGDTQRILAQGRLLVKEEKGEFWPAVAGPRTCVTWLCATSTLHVWVPVSVSISGWVWGCMSWCLLSRSLGTYTNMAVCRAGVGRKELYLARLRRSILECLLPAGPLMERTLESVPAAVWASPFTPVPPKEPVSQAALTGTGDLGVLRSRGRGLQWDKIWDSGSLRGLAAES